jgi:D-glycero-alpha-D-manno-heptose-7-phosphate kinase
MQIRARAPLRLGLAGGGSDLSPYCDEFGGYVLNATIDRYAYAVLEPLDTARLEFIGADRQEQWCGSPDAPLDVKGALGLHKAVYNRVVKSFNGGRPLPVRMTTYADAPAGSGLGSSSTLVVAMLKGFQELLNLPLGDYELAHLAYEIERLDVGLQGGRQDQYAATFGGFNFMEFYANDRVIVNPLRVKNWILSELEASLLLFYTGVSRESARIIAEQSDNVRQGDAGAVDAMHSIKQEAVQMKESLLRGDFTGFVDSMRASWESKKKTAATVSTPVIEQVYEAARSAGALAGKVSGAGGGGFMMFFVDPIRRMDVMRALEPFAGQVRNCHFTKHGTQGWRIG